ncbi:MAG: hypothetical protein GC182_15445 [Rhodopseudomonas sp.]|nr:hypothetical protein [Rhodopseudomonas sp.]
MAPPRPCRYCKPVIAIALAMVLGLAPCPDRAHAQAACGNAAIGSGTVAAVRDGRTVLLANGHEVRLTAIESGVDGGTMLHHLTIGKIVRLSRPEGGKTGEFDRYGRLIAFATPEDAAQSLQMTLLNAGQALVSARIGSKACADVLLSAEKAARAAKRGLWANPNSAPLSSDNLAGLEASRGHFALVEGHVLSVRESGAIVYVNFGRHWTRDFTVTVLKRQRRAFAAAGIDLTRLEGRRIRVRGFIEQRGGPIIAATAPEQIELIE